jgi:hypothetical protein
MQSVDDYLVICHYKINSPHNAIFIPMVGVSFAKLKKEYDKMISLFNPDLPSIICKMLTGGYLINDSIDNTEETENIVKHFLKRANNDYDYDCDYVYDDNDVSDYVSNKQVSYIFPYYINDNNKYLSPIDLHNKILSMDKYKNHKFNVKKCIIIISEAMIK